ncbi:MAG: TIGR02757 family protein [Deltaproteobacteria bacterium]|nr:TIGR02757 family protein [Deltaproteobacteria bacterium]
MDLKKLKTRLERLYRTYDRTFLSSDPLWFVHRFKTDRDREIAGLISSSLAYGRVEGIKKSVGRVLDVMDWRPHAFTMGFVPRRRKRAFPDFTHRFNSGSDVACLIYFARQMIAECGSIGGFFLEGYSPEDKNIKNSLSSFSKRALDLDCGGIYGSKKLPARAGVRFFFPSPEAGSPCKRLNLYLRWMVRRGDSLDLGIWKEVAPSQLVIPLDTHVARISRHIGLTARKSPDWLMAEEITDNLKRLDPFDPVRYDFAISRLGILEECRRRKDAEKCRACLIKDVCVIR